MGLVIGVPYNVRGLGLNWPLPPNIFPSLSSNPYGSWLGFARTHAQIRVYIRYFILLLFDIKNINMPFLFQPVNNDNQTHFRPLSIKELRKLYFLNKNERNQNGYPICAVKQSVCKPLFHHWTICIVVLVFEQNQWNHKLQAKPIPGGMAPSPRFNFLETWFEIISNFLANPPCKVIH